MKYALLICDDETISPEPGGTGRRSGTPGLGCRPGPPGREVFGARLRPVADATTIRVRGGETLVSDGPFAETKDLVGGIVILECADVDEAIEIAAGHPWAQRGCVEIRPIWE